MQQEFISAYQAKSGTVKRVVFISLNLLLNERRKIRNNIIMVRALEEYISEL